MRSICTSRYPPRWRHYPSRYPALTRCLDLLRKNTLLPPMVLLASTMLLLGLCVKNRFACNTTCCFGSIIPVPVVPPYGYLLSPQTGMHGCIYRQACMAAYAMQCNAMQCNAMQCNAMQCNAMQCNAMQCNARQSKYRCSSCAPPWKHIIPSLQELPRCPCLSESPLITEHTGRKELPE